MMARRDPLSDYNTKRDFTRTAEPKGKRDTSGGQRFLVQKHDATRLHWDFRLEMDGVLKSWAVTRGPSLDPDDKRLAVRTEDHPLDYATFEGTIPKGEYGGGTVMLWDEGTWEAVGGKDPTKTIEEGHVHVILHGHRMNGEWLLVRMKPRGNEKRENWLLRKVEDEEAGASDTLVEEALTSVTTGRTMAQIAAGETPVTRSKSTPEKPSKTTRTPAKSAKAKGGKSVPPAFRAIQLATLVERVPEGSDWIHEIKYDGYRTLLAIGGGAVKAYTRTGLDWSDTFAPVCDAASQLDIGSALIDGEVVALDADGRPSFSALQRALKEGGALHYFAFDLLEQDSEDLSGLPNLERKERLAALMQDAPTPLHYADHVVGAGEKLFQRLCKDGYEGVVSKRADASYRGTRSRNWLKIKCTRRQEFVVLGYGISDKAGRGLKSLLVGVHDGGALRYAGRVGTGFDAATRDMLVATMEPLARKTPAADVPKAVARGVHWVKPSLVVEIAFSEFTADHILRHPSYIGLRQDKPAKDVVVEQPVAVQDETGGGENPDNSYHGVTITHPERVIDPTAPTTKGALAAYYAKLADPLLAWLANRPVSLVRCPQGREKQCFFQKHDGGSFGDRVDRISIPDTKGKQEDYLVVNTPESLLTCVQMGTIELHGWGSPADDIEHPDRMIFDLDPDEGVDFATVRNAAVQLRDLLAEMGLQSFAMVSGGKGVHVVVPLDGSADWPAVKDFASRFAQAVSSAHPDRFTANMRKAQRKGKIFIDWLRNERGATAVMPYSARARPRTSVAAPVEWNELASMETAAPFTIKDADTLLTRAKSKALKAWGKADQALPDT